VTHIRDDVGRLPLQCALENKCRDSKLVKLLCTSEQAVLDSDRINRNSLHLALERNVNPCIVETLLHRAPQAARAFHASALQTCYHHYVQARDERRVEKCWNVLTMVLRAYDYESLNYCKLHVALATNAPVKVIQRILDESPQQVRQPNAEGRYPLAIACEMNTNVDTKDGIIHLILNLDESVALMADSNNGQSVLSIVAKHGGVSACAIYRLICVNPQAVTRLDSRLGLYPFMIAAMSRDNEEDKRGVSRFEETTTDDSSANIQIGAIYELLLAAPHLIK